MSSAAFWVAESAGAVGWWRLLLLLLLLLCEPWLGVCGLA